MKKEYGPSQAAEMLHVLAEAAKEFRRNELILTNHDASMLESMGVEAPTKVRNSVCSQGHQMKNEVE